MAGFGHVMKIFIGAGFPRMGFPGYIMCLYVVSCDNVARFNLTVSTLSVGIKGKHGS